MFREEKTIFTAITVMRKPIQPQETVWIISEPVNCNLGGLDEEEWK